MDETGQTEAPPRLSRYRSVRRAQAQQAQPPEAPPMPPMPPMPEMPPAEQPPQQAQQASMSRSMSRYHRRPTTSHATNPNAPPLRSATVNVPPPPSSHGQPSVGTAATARSRAVSSPQAHDANNAQARAPNTSRTREAAPGATSSPTGDRPRPKTARDEAQQLLHNEKERQRRLREKLDAEKREKLRAEQAEQERLELQRREEEAERQRAQREAEEAEAAERRRRLQEHEEKERGKRLQKAESAKRAQEREEAERKARVDEAMRRAQSSPPASPPRHGGFGLFKRRRDDAQRSPEGSPNSKPQTSHGNRDMENIRPGGGGAVLGIDAPVSAVNAGDRRVTVVCNNKAFMLPVTPETTAQDLLKSAGLCMTETIHVESDLLVESFRKVGLKRPLRVYEHVRDVMNSWDNDTQNDLEIVSNNDEKNWARHTLIASTVPDAKPEPFGCFIQYSSRPGKWSKKYISLRTDGQLVMSKNETAKDCDNICHLSDFDIYKPTDKKRSKISPPKKHVWAVKSQQKSNIFSDETRYVHFFCTNDASVSDQFYAAIQVWRSWHLKHVMGEGQKKKAQDSKVTNGSLAKGNASPLGSLGQGASTSHTRNASVGSYYQLGSFKPLLDLESFDKELDAVTSPRNESSPARADTQAMHARKMSTRVKNPPPTAFGRSGIVGEPLSATDRMDSVTQSTGFASTSLLGDVYAQKQKALQEREKQASGPFTEGPSLISSMDKMTPGASNEGGLNRMSSVRSNHVRSSSDIQRSASTRIMPRPLIDLTPQYREPPQHRNKGKGFTPEAGVGPLIENATSIEEAIKIPSSTDWRRQPAAGRTHGTYGTGGFERTRSLKGRGEGLAAYTVNNHAGAPTDESNAFTGGGLLARAGLSQGRQPVGHGVMDGSKARGPMLDFRDNAQFASGSLLATVEHRQGPSRPVIDREKRGSVDFG